MLDSSSKVLRPAPTKKTIALYAHQLEAHFGTEQTIAMVGGTGGGKTWYAPIWVTKNLMEPDMSHFRWGVRGLGIGTGYQKHVDRVMVHELKRFFNEQGITYDFNQGKAVFFLPNDVQFMMGSSENANSLEGPHLDGCVWMDEAGLMPLLAWEVAQRRTAQKSTPILITSVPYYPNWLKTHVYDKWLAGETWVRWIQIRSTDNKSYPSEAIERLRSQWRPDKVERYLEGNFAKPFGLIYDVPSSLIVDYETEFAQFGGEVPEEWPCFAGHDWGLTAPTTGVWIRLSPEDVAYVVAEYEVPELTMAQHVAVWKGLGLDLVDYAWGDPAAPEQWLNASDLGYPVVQGENNVLYGIDLVYDRLKTGRLKVMRGCKTIVDHLSTYVWAPDPKNEDELLEKPKKPQPAEHMMDALRYLVAGLVEYGVAPAAPELSVVSRHLGKM